MNEKTKIIVVDKDEEMGHKIREVFESWNSQKCEVSWFSAFVIEEVRGAYCVIIDSRLVKDIKNLIEVMHALSVKKIILATNELNHPLSSAAIMMGATVFYRHSPITTLMTKIFDNYKPEKPSRPMMKTEYSTKDLDKNFSSLSEFDNPFNDYSEKDNSNSFDNNIPNPDLMGSQKKHINLDKGSERTKSRLLNSDRGKCVAVYSPKGGSGKTSLAINLAIQFASKNLRVLILDYATYGNIGVRLKIHQKTSGLSNIFNALTQNGVDFDSFDNLLKNNIYSYTNVNETIKFDVLISDIPKKMLDIDIGSIEFITNTVRSLEYDIVIIDTSSEQSKLNLAIFEMCNDILLVSTPDTCSIWNLIYNKDLMQSLNVHEKCKLVVNMHQENIGFSFKELEIELQSPLVGIIPEYNKIKIIENNGRFISLEPNEQINTFYRQIAHSLLPVFSGDDIKIVKKKFSFDLMKKFDGIKKKVQK